jgi:hypothetical protein
MSKIVSCCIAAVVLAAVAPARAMDLGYSALGGYQNGVGTRVNATATNLIPGLPVGLSFGVGLAFVDPGNAGLARQVFINQADNGTPEKAGSVVDFRLDAIYLLRVSSLDELGLFAGIRYVMFDGRFHYVGGNEDFDIRGRDFAYGLGLRGAIRMNQKWSLGLQAGFDFMPSRTLTGHDATYSSNGSSINARDDGNGYTYRWADAKKAVNYPLFTPSVLFGVTWRP